MHTRCLQVRFPVSCYQKTIHLKTMINLLPLLRPAQDSKLACHCQVPSTSSLLERRVRQRNNLNARQRVRYKFQSKGHLEILVRLITVNWVSDSEYYGAQGESCENRLSWKFIEVDWLAEHELLTYSCWICSLLNGLLSCSCLVLFHWF